MSRGRVGRRFYTPLRTTEKTSNSIRLRRRVTFSTVSIISGTSDELDRGASAVR